MSEMCDDFADFFTQDRLLISDTDNMIMDLSKSYVRLNSEVALLEPGNITIRRDHLEMNKVKLLSGGPSGHEPAFDGYVGKGFLTASVRGEIYCTPSSEDILIAIKTLSRQNVHGVMIIIGDTLQNRLNFGYAVESALNIPNVQVKMLFVTDAISGTHIKHSSVGIVIVQKIAAAMSELGSPLDEIHDYCTSVLDDIQTITMTIPNSTKDIKKNVFDEIDDDNGLEFGTGINGEPPYLKMPPISTRKAVEIMLEQINVSKPDSSKEFIDSETPVLVLINNLGCTTKLEELIFIQEVMSQFEMNKLRICKIYIGTFMTSLRSIGLSITLMRLDKPQVLDYISYPCDISFWREFTPLDPEIEMVLTSTYKTEVTTDQPRGPHLNNQQADLIKTITLFVCKAIMSCERQLNIMDAELGDADTGTNLRKACTLILNQMQNSNNFFYPYELFQELAGILWKNNVGLSGSIFCLIFEKTSDVFLAKSNDDIIDSFVWLKILKVAASVVQRYGKTYFGAKNLYDPMYSCVREFETGLKNGIDGIKAFELGVMAAAKTDNLRTQFKGVRPDPGTHAVNILLRAVFDVLKNETETHNVSIITTPVNM